MIGLVGPVCHARCSRPPWNEPSASTTSAAPGKPGTPNSPTSSWPSPAQPDAAPATRAARGRAHPSRATSERSAPRPSPTKTAEERGPPARSGRSKALEAPGAEVPLPDRLRLHEVDPRPLGRQRPAYALVPAGQHHRRVPLRWGPWRALKRIFKEAEARGDYRGLRRPGRAVRRGLAPAAQAHGRRSASARWPTCAAGPGGASAGMAEHLPAAYADAAADVLAALPGRHPLGQAPGSPTTSSSTRPSEYDRSRFKFNRRAARQPARSTAPSPSCGGAARGRCSRCWSGPAATGSAQFAAGGAQGRLPRLAARGRAGLGGAAGRRAAAPPSTSSWSGSSTTCRGSSRAPSARSGLHEAGAPAVRLALDRGPRLRRRVRPDPRPRPAASTSWSAWPTTTMRRSASWPPTCSRARPAQRGRPGGLGPAAGDAARATSCAAGDPAQALRRPRADAGVVPRAAVLREPRGLRVRQRAAPQVHPTQTLGAAASSRADRAIERLTRPHAGGTSPASPGPARAVRPGRRSTATFFAALLLHPLDHAAAIAAWIDEGRLKARTLGLDFLKALAFQPDWEADPWVAALRRERPGLGPGPGVRRGAGRAWSSAGCGDVRSSRPGDLGFDWLMRLAAAASRATTTSPSRR